MKKAAASASGKREKAMQNEEKRVDFTEEKGRIYAADETGAAIAEIVFEDEGGDSVCVVRTYVAEGLRGQGIAGKLMEAAAEAAKRRGKKLVAACSYAEAWLQRHPEYTRI